MKRSATTTIVATEMGMNNFANHVAEHESNHDGQIKLRLPGAKPSK